jgi:hypothetical protein
MTMTAVSTASCGMTKWLPAFLEQFVSVSTIMKILFDVSSRDVGAHCKEQLANQVSGRDNSKELLVNVSKLLK